MNKIKVDRSREALAISTRSMSDRVQARLKCRFRLVPGMFSRLKRIRRMSLGIVSVALMSAGLSSLAVADNFSGSFTLQTNSSNPPCWLTANWISEVPYNGASCGGVVHTWVAAATQTATITVNIGSGYNWAAATAGAGDTGTIGGVASFYECSLGPGNGVLWYLGNVYGRNGNSTLTTPVTAGVSYCLMGAIGFWGNPGSNSSAYPNDSFNVSYTGFALLPPNPTPTDGPLPLWAYALLGLAMWWIAQRRLQGLSRPSA